MKHLPAPSSPTVAIARVLRDLGLTQGRGCDFRVTGDYRNGERIGTYVLSLTRHADEVIAEHADEIERLSDETGWAFRVSVRYPNGARPMVTVANYGSRVRETPPAPAATEEPEAAPVVPAPAATEEAAPEPQPEAVPEPQPQAAAAHFLEGARERAWQRQQANALGWSARQADLVLVAMAGALCYDRNGVLRDQPRPGCAGTAVDESRLGPLLVAGFLVITEPNGPGSKRVSVTADGRDALTLWRRWRPTPAMKDRKQDREPLRPLPGGEEATRRARALIEDDRQRRAERDALYAALDELRDWEERDERMWKAWATVQGITYRLGRNVPAGWVPTAEEVAEHRLDAEVVAELRAEAARPTPRPELPKAPPLRPVELPPLPAAPDETEQLSLFAPAAA
ncbi:hypothetical protein ACFU93_32480 [Streptomyces sp. NPDC057611]|uniref:hypothetical protein n=1 Tax=Streptomyces sp. NPDC057611 TaxID=3346182 RepID=UPI0036C35EA8